MKEFWKEAKFIIVVLLFATLGLTVGINKPFIGHHDWNNQFFSQVANNYLRYGLLPLRFGQLIGSNSPMMDFGGGYYTHHPILLPLSLAVSIGIFGYNQWAVRLVPILFSLSTLIFFYLLLRRYFQIRTTLIAIGFLLVTPMFLYFGKMANHEAPTLFFIIFVIYQFLRWRDGKDKRAFYWCLAGLIAGQLTGWPAYYLGIILTLWSRKKIFLAVTLTSFLIFILHIAFLTGSPIGGGLLQVLLFRMGLGQLSWAVETYTNRQLLLQELRWSYHFFTPPLFLASILAAVMSLYTRWKKNVAPPKGGAVWAILFLVALAHVLLFRTGAWRHDYWLYYFLPVYSWGIAYGISILSRQFPQKSLLIYALYLVALMIAFVSSQPFFWALQATTAN